MPKTAFITGITGQDGSYLAEQLLARGYDVHGLVRRSSTFNTERIDHIREQIQLHYGDITDATALFKLIQEVGPDEIYNLAAQSHVRVSFDMPKYTWDVVAGGTLNILEAARELNKTKKVRFYQASSSEQFGDVVETPQTENTPFRPRSPYACAKAAAHYLTVNYREAYGLHATAAVLHNHESPRRGESFVTRKITMAVARIYCGLQDELFLGNLDAMRDWGFAGDYTQAMWLMLQQDTPDDYVIATGETHSVKEFLTLAFGYVGLDYKHYVKFDERFCRPSEVNLLCGNAKKAYKKLGWTPTTTFRELVVSMVKADLAAVRKTLMPTKSGIDKVGATI